MAPKTDLGVATHRQWLSTKSVPPGLTLLGELLLLLLVAGCPSVVEQTPVDTGDAATPSEPGGGTATPGQRISGEPNDTFNEALDVVLDSAGTGRVAGSIATANDVDVYRLGEFLVGDRIIVDVGAQSSGLDADVALFDGGGRLIYENDDRNIDLNQLDPLVNHVVRHDTMILYVAIAASPLNPTTGTYDGAIAVTRGGQAPATAAQTVVLQTTGGTVTAGGDSYTVGPFDTGDISDSYRGETNQVLDQIIATVLENYAGLQLTVLVSSRDEIPPGCSASAILLGGSNPNAYGLAQNIDWYNADHCDDAIVFTDMFQPFRFGRTLTAEELGTAIGNVVSHEVGHLLGLNHVDNIQDIMDTTGTAETFLLDQEFTTSPLDGTIFPIGVQDGLLLLMETLGAVP